MRDAGDVGGAAGPSLAVCKLAASGYTGAIMGGNGKLAQRMSERTRGRRSGASRTQSTEPNATRLPVCSGVRRPTVGMTSE